MGTQSKFQLGKSTLLFLMGCLLAILWLLPSEANLWSLLFRLVVLLATFRVLAELKQFARNNGVLPDYSRLIEMDRKKRIQTNLRLMGFTLLLCAAVIALSANLISHFFKIPLPSPHDLSLVLEMALLAIILFVFAVQPVLSQVKAFRQVHARGRKSVEDRLDELERLKRRDMVTPEEYAAKRQEILKDL